MAGGLTYEHWNWEAKEWEEAVGLIEWAARKPLWRLPPVNHGSPLANAQHTLECYCNIHKFPVNTFRVVGPGLEGAPRKEPGVC